MTLAEQTARRLELAGIWPDDPGLAHIRAWNAAAYRRAGLPEPCLHGVGNRGQTDTGLTHQPGAGK